MIRITTLLKIKWTVGAAAVMVVAASGGARRWVAERRGDRRWLWTFNGRGGDAAAVDVFLM